MGLGLSVLGVPLFGGKKPTSRKFLVEETTGVTAAYSTTKQLSEKAQLGFRLVRVSDLAEKDIGFVDGFVDHDDALTFLGGQQGTVKVIYDQTENEYNLIQNQQTQQPLYSSFGATFDGVDDEMVVAQPTHLLPYSLFAKLQYISYKPDQNAGLNNLLSSSDGDNLILRSYSSNAAQVYAGNYISTAYPLVEGQTFLLTTHVESGNSSAYKDGVLISSSVDAMVASQGFQVGSRPGVIRYANILMDTIAFYSGNQSINQELIESFFLNESGMDLGFSSGFGS